MKLFQTFSKNEILMIIYERKRAILNYLEQNNFSTFRELAAAVYASESSVRRDVKALEGEGYVKTTYGGVVLASYVNGIVPVKLRESENAAIKDNIAEKAAKHVFDGATLLLDGSSTVRRIVKHLSSFNNLKIITNNYRLFSEAEGFNGTIYSTGGRYDIRNKIFIGSVAEEFIRGITADVMFFSSQALSDDGEITDISEEETSLRKVMISRAKKKVFLCDSSKLGKKQTFTLCTKDDVDEIICDKRLPWE